MKKLISSITVIAMLFQVVVSNAQINMPKPSPDAKIMQKIGMAEVSIAYSRPQAKGRKIFGDVVQFDKIWRTGANMPTKITISDSIAINGKKIAGGEYALYTIPSAAEWTIILGNNPMIQAGEFKEENAVAKFKVKSEALSAMVETFTIGFVNITATSSEVEISWEKTAVKFKLEFDADSKVMEDIKKKTEVDPNTLFQSASYYYDNNKDLNQALKWITVSTDKNPQFWTLNMKAKIQLKLKDYAGAIVSAQKSSEMAKAAKNEEYVKFNQKVIDEATAQMGTSKTKKK